MLTELWLLITVDQFKSEVWNALATLLVNTAYWVGIAAILTAIVKSI